MKAFTKLLSPREARDAFRRVYAPGPLGAEWVPLLQAFGRALAEEVRAGSDLPPFDRAMVDGYAVRAADTRGASSGAPVPLRLAGEVLMGAPAGLTLAAGQAVRVPTGGAIPEGADAVVMQEHTVRKDGTVSVERPATAGDHIIRRGDDLRAGELVLRPGRRLRASDVGLLAGLNHAEVEVFRRPMVAVIVTGDELLSPGREVLPGQIYDMNTYALSGLIEESGGVPVPYGIVGDNLQLVVERAKAAHQANDVVLLSGGSSVGERDVVIDAVAALGEPGVVVHGISIRPGKPTILALANGKPVFGLPGNVVSSLIIFREFVRPVVQALAGIQEARRFGDRIRAHLATTVATGEREDHVRVALVEREGTVWATPVPGGSAIMTSMVRADGVVVIPARTTVSEGEEVEVDLFA